MLSGKETVEEEVPRRCENPDILDRFIFSPDQKTYAAVILSMLLTA